LYVGAVTTGAESSAGVASLRTDLALAREEIKRLRSHNDNLRRKAQRLLGEQLERANVGDLIARVDSLVDENRQLAAKLHESIQQCSTLRSQVTELEEDVAAAQTAIRPMIREQTSGIGSPKP
jgi:predicted nuclease with TOPRIM domain